MNTDKICRCCLALDVPLLSIYDGGSAGMGCVADMLKQIAQLIPQPADNMPGKACLQCISEINRCYVFKMKCENSNRTLRQLLPDALPEPLLGFTRKKGFFASSAVQTDDKILISSMVQTVNEYKSLLVNSSVQTITVEKPFVCDREIQTDCELTEFGGHQKNLEDILIYEEIDSPKENMKRHIQSSPENKDINKKICLESNKTNTLLMIEEPQSTDEQTSAYIVLEDSNCSEGPEIYEQSSIEIEKFCEPDRVEYYENEGEEFQEEQKDFIYEEDYSNENFNNQTIYEIESSDGKTKSDEEAEAIIKPRNSRSKPKGQYKCSQCIMTFVSMKVLKRHLANRHDIKDAELIIDYLPPAETDEISTSLDDHSAIHTTRLNNTIELTPENVVKPQLMPREKTTKVNEEPLTNIKYFCDNCQAGFAQRKTLSYHIKHQVCMTNSFKCNICESIFVSEKNLETHKLTHENPHKCLECDTVCKTIEDLSQHMISTHNRSARNQCHVCKKVFTMKTSLNDHLRIHSGEKPFLCTICGKSFRQNSNLRQHLIRHTNEKNFKCDMCTNAYVTKAELFSHKRTHTGDHPFKCDICQSRFTTSCSLRKHIRKHTGERPYACEYCPMRFAALNVLKNHRRIHTGEKPYKCAHCAKTFTQKGDCLMHERTHLNGDFKCFCDSKFSKKSNLTYHLKMQHTDLSETEIQALLDKSARENVDNECQMDLMENVDENIVEFSESKVCLNNKEEVLEIVMEDVM